jgi:Prolyl oligopeptidase family
MRSGQCRRAHAPRCGVCHPRVNGSEAGFVLAGRSSCPTRHRLGSRWSLAQRFEIGCADNTHAVRWLCNRQCGLSPEPRSSLPGADTRYQSGHSISASELRAISIRSKSICHRRLIGRRPSGGIGGGQRWRLRTRREPGPAPSVVFARASHRFVRVPALELFLGGQPDAKPELARLASPVAHVDRNDPPLWLYHGDQDPQMPINQAHELHGAYKRAGLPVSFEVLHDAKHGGPEFFHEERLRKLSEELLRVKN